MGPVELVLVVTVLGVASGLIGGLLGSWGGRDRSISGFVLGLLLGPVGWLIVLFAGPSRRAKKRAEEGRVLAGALAASDHRPRVACPYCAKLVVEGAIVCRHCGNDLVAVPASSSGPRQLPCIFCHALNPMGATACEHCGRDLFTR